MSQAHPHPVAISALRAQLQSGKASWSIESHIADTHPIPEHALGAVPPARAVLASHAKKLDLKRTLKTIPRNPFIVERRVANSLLPASQLVSRPSPGFLTRLRPDSHAPNAQRSAAAPSAGAGRAVAVDWRNRWGWPWITSVQDQGICESCWAFCAAGIVESMVRIEHCVWSKRSEGDIRDGMNAKCANGGWHDPALDWVAQNGVCDLACYPYKTDDSAYRPTPDRSGRTERIAGHVDLGDIEQQKVWLDSVGPIGCVFEVFHDFDVFGQVGIGVYRKVDAPDNASRGLHCVMVVGYDDDQQAWLIKNSWGKTWHGDGYAYIGYGEVSIDNWAKPGVQNVNPDPWTKRRLHAGAMIESGDGATHRNFELVTAGANSAVQHWWRQGGEGGDFSWHAGAAFGNDCAACPTLTGTTFNRNFEMVYLTTQSNLHHWYFDQSSGNWLDGGAFGPPDAAGLPAFLQGNYGAPGNFEVVVRTADGMLNHWWRDNAWHDGGRFGSQIAYSGGSMVQSHYGTQGNLELVATLQSGQMQHFWRDDDNGNVWNAGPMFGSNVQSPPCMIEGQFGAGDENAVGNFELCVAAGGQVQHWRRDNAGGSGQWFQSATFGHDALAVAAMVEGSFGFNLEIVVQLFSGQFQHYWRDGGGWHEGPLIQ